MLDINLLNNNLKKILKRQQLAKKVNLYVSIAFGLVLVITLSLFGVGFYFRTQLNQEEERLVNIQAQIASYNSIFIAMEEISGRLQSIEQILDARLVAEEKVDLFIDIVNSQLFNLETVGFGDTGSPLLFEFTAESPNLRTYIEGDSYIKSIAEQRPFESIALNGLLKQRTGSYTYTYRIFFDEEKINEK